MLILDTDYLSELDRETSISKDIASRLKRSADQVTTTIISVEEQLRGPLAIINRPCSQEELIARYERFQRCIARIPTWPILPWNAAATAKLNELRPLRTRISTHDLRIASIALAHNATLLSRNRRDFRRVPNLRVEDWLDEPQDRDTP